MPVIPPIKINDEQSYTIAGCGKLGGKKKAR